MKTLVLLLPLFTSAKISLLSPKPQSVNPAPIDARVMAPPKDEIKSAPARKEPPAPAGNLPKAYALRLSYEAPASAIVLTPSESPGLMLLGVRAGEVVEAEVPEGILAYPGSKSPVRALVKKGKLQGAGLTGEASLEKNSKRILIRFSKIHFKDKSYEIEAHALDFDGVLGLLGEYYSDEPWFFAGEFLSAASSALADSSIDRSKTAFGDYAETPGMDRAMKGAGAAAAASTAQHFSEKIKSAPEYSTLVGPIRIKALILTSAKLVK